jgi:hypothetical protein
VRGKSVLVIGCGAVGAPVAEALLRMGVTRLGLVDPEPLEMGNLSRHILTMADIGRNKAEALAARLNGAIADAAVVAFPIAFPPEAAPEREAVAAYDVILDCTGADDLLDELAEFDWPGEKIFVSLAMTWEARGLVAFSASEAAFPALDARYFFADASPRPDTERDMTMEGLGCWHPIFPAGADDILFWAGLGARFACAAVLDPARRRVHFHRLEDGGLVRDDH